jgi:hypothetical protein
MKSTMMRTVCSLLVGFSLAAGAEAQQCAQADTGSCANFQRREPIVMWDVTGYTLAGALVHGRLVVYNDGVTSVSSGNGDVRIEAVAPAAAQALRGDLIQAGATTLCDQKQVTADMPLTTLTMFVGSTEAQAHTFSYWVANNGYAAVQAAIDGFLATHFPGFAVN